MPRDGAASLSLDDLSLFVSGRFGRFVNPFAEAELAQVDLARTGSGGGEGGDLVLERFYNDSFLSEAVTLRVGKMLAPVGEWNEIHANPLVLTTVRPAVTYRNFSEYVTGASLIYSDPFARWPDVQLYWQPEGELSERPGHLVEHHYESVEGLHVSLPLGLLDKVGASFQHARDEAGVDQSLIGLDFHYTLDRLTLQGEATWSDLGNDSAGNARDGEWGAYAAASFALDDQWSLQGWYEGFADRTRASTAHDVLFGVTWKPQPAIVGRLEYLQNFGGTEINPTGLYASWSVLF
ncbi:hypothetical protein SAMN06265365_121107 [Tistlia consotensis]|uniref:Uncharacterized protein n=1 Tax=Tistlia consotensis USBA 355 TaxID=560819 RepID=A0A1Y6CGC8_9PROT|nr:hypothetical protein [Tistlia consotensis]SMF60097.1 hypothetical protein SAMN05428998_12316 [Tistlia consotensis USBA 355]SNR93876.1 hypothetical protein SAMN06265365_121107 [Tistlia consotensis]